LPHPRKEADTAGFSLCSQNLSGSSIFARQQRSPSRKPIAHSITLVMSQPVPKADYGYLVMFGEFITVTGKLTIQTQIIWERSRTQGEGRIVALAVEAIIFASLNDAEKEEAGETGAQEHDEEGVDDLMSMLMAGEIKGYYGKENEICAACEV
jgi:hypothetical protein